VACRGNREVHDYKRSALADYKDVCYDTIQQDTAVSVPKVEQTNKQQQTNKTTNKNNKQKQQTKQQTSNNKKTTQQIFIILPLITNIHQKNDLSHIKVTL